MSGYLIEAWVGLDCVWFKTFRQRRVIPAAVATAIVDAQADRIYIRRRSDGHTVAHWTPGSGWRAVEPEVADFLNEKETPQ